MELRHFIFAAFLLISVGISAQSFQVGPALDLQSKRGNGLFLEDFSSSSFTTIYEPPSNLNASRLFPGILFTYNFENGNILEARVQGMFEKLAIVTFSSPVETDANYQLVAGIDYYKRINTIQSSKASFYFGGGLGYSRDRIAISGFNELDGYERYINWNGLLVSAGFRSNIQFSSWFALTASANLEFLEISRESRVTRNVTANGGISDSLETNNFNTSFYSYFRIGTLFTLYSKK
jgi:hypothetical protein